MPLPILTESRNPSGEDLVRFCYQALLHWSQHLGESEQTDVGTAILNPELPRVYDANRIFNAALPEADDAPPDAMQAVEALYAQRSVRCHKWVPNPAAPQERTAPLAEHLRSLGYRRDAADILYLQRAAGGALQEAPGLTIFPARASYRHARQLAEEASRAWHEPQLVEASMLHLDDPHYDALIALRDGTAVASIGVLAVGEVGLIEQVYVSEPHRRQGVGRTMMGRAMEICARSLFKHVFLIVDPENRAASELYQAFGFRKIGQFVEYAAPDTLRRPNPSP